MDDLVRWLGDQLDEDTARAETAPPGPWTIDGAGSIVDANGAKVIRSVGGWRLRWPEGPAAEFITAHDPARVLREIEAKRQLVSAYAEAQQIVDAMDYPDMADVYRAAGLETAVRLLALPCSDRPGYLEEWRP